MSPPPPSNHHPINPVVGWVERFNEETELRFNLCRSRGRPVPVPAGSGAGYAHEHTRPDGTTFIVLRDQRGKLMRGARLCDLRAEGLVGREPTTAESVVRAALSLPSRRTESNRRRGK